jgi:hypothetical protein
MSEENETKTSKVTETIEAVSGLVKVVPIYQDLIQPAAREVGKSLETVAKSVNVALSPLKGLVWSFDKIQKFIDTRVSGKLKNTPESDIQTPKGNIVVPALQALSYTDGEPELQELFANLIAGSMDKNTSKFAHPSFVETIKQLTPDEAKLLGLLSKGGAFPLVTIRSELKEGEGGLNILRHVSLLGEKAKCDNPQLTSVALDNLQRQGLIVIPRNFSYTEKAIYKELKEHPKVVEIINKINSSEGHTAMIVEEIIEITNYGSQFIQICVVSHELHRK